MTFTVIKKEFKLVGLKGSGEFEDFGNDVPLLAQQLLSRSNEIQYSTKTEIALFEPKKDEHHKIGHYYVGLCVDEKLTEIPTGLHYLETANKRYVTTRGSISNLNELHTNLLNWALKQGYQRDLQSYIIETYHPIKGGDEEVQIFLPVQE